MKKTLLVVGLAWCLGCVAQDSASRFAPALTPLPIGAVRPGGWLLAQIKDNLSGFTGHLDSLVPSLILQDDIFGDRKSVV